MKVFVAGATGVLGRQLVPQLVAKGHEVVGMTRSGSKQDLVRNLGARPVVADALDPDAVAQAVASAEPEVIVHQLTALSGEFDMRHIDRFFETTNRLRTEGTDHLLAAGRAVGARRFVAQSYAACRPPVPAEPVKGEDAPFDPDPPDKLRGMLDAIRHLEEAVTGAEWLEGVVLRYGRFYGPGTTLSPTPQPPTARLSASASSPSSGTAAASGRSFTSTTPRRRPPSRSSTVSAASTTSWTTSPRRRASGCPSWRARWAPSRRGACRVWLGRLLAGETAAVMMTEVRGASNEKAKRELGWKPRYPSWRQGFAQGLG